MAVVVDHDGRCRARASTADDTLRCRPLARIVEQVRHNLGEVDRVAVEGTGSYGAGIKRFLQRHDVIVIEVDRPNRQDRRRNGKSDELDAIEAARAALSRRAEGVAKTGDGDVEAIRALLVARRSARAIR